MKINMIKYIFLILLLTSVIYGCGSDVTHNPSPTSIPTATPTVTGLEVKTIQVKDKLLQVEIADDPEERATGLMYRTELGENSGMLFVFPTAGNHSFWMKNTYIPLSIAFITGDGVIRQIEDMEPETTDSHRSNAMVIYALEVNQGWFEANDIKVGDKIILD